MANSSFSLENTLDRILAKYPQKRSVPTVGVLRDEKDSVIDIRLWCADRLALVFSLPSDHQDAYALSLRICRSSDFKSDFKSDLTIGSGFLDRCFALSVC